jgi:alanine racemase/UDP-N-acetylmuramoyl-tripeptide--D-alanyl-D-alanine ligase
LTPRQLTEDGQIVELAAAGGAGSREFHLRARSPHVVADLHFAAAAAHLLGLDLDEIAQRLEDYSPRPTRMEFWSSPDRVRIVNDAYSADPVSVHAALRAAALGAAGTGRRVFAFAGVREMGAREAREHYQIGAEAAACDFSHLVLMGDAPLSETRRGFEAARPGGTVVAVEDTTALKDYLLGLLRPGDTVLFKGPRDCGMARAARELSGSIAQRCLHVEMSAIAGNLARFQRHCGGRVKIMAMLKALAYGTDLVQLAFWMSHLGIHQIGVSSTAEGMAIRKVGVQQDIYVVLPDRDDADNLARHRLTPMLYSDDLVDAFAATLARTKTRLDVHLMVNTGMNHLGVEPEEAVVVARHIADSGVLRLTGVATHFAAADDPAQDEFTRGTQIARFERTLAALRAAGFRDLIAHAANTAGTIRFPEAHYDMVRIGIGLYGVHTAPAVAAAMPLELAVGVTSRIASVRTLRAGEAVGYNRTYTAAGERRIAIVPFGYDDGLPWALAGTDYHALVEGRPAAIVGRIAMDQMQIDVTDVPGATAGTEVLLYGAHGGYQIRPEEVATKAGSIPHELLVRLGKRVERIYIEP